MKVSSGKQVTGERELVNENNNVVFETQLEQVKFTNMLHHTILTVTKARTNIGRYLSLSLTKHQTVIDPPDDPEFLKPRKRENESLEVRKARLLYQSRKRGMLENDLLLSTFAAKYLKTFNEKQVEEYDDLINKPSNDWDIFNWANGTKPTPKEYNTDVMRLFKEHVKNVQKEQRLRQPDL